MNKETSPYVKAAVLFILIAVIALSVYVGFYLLRFLRDPEQFRAWIDSFGIYAPLAYLAVTALQIFIPMIPGEPMEMIAGYAFGSLEGTFWCFLGESIAGIVILLMVRKYGRRIVEIFFTKEKINSLSFLQSSKNRVVLFSIIFVAPGTPKDLFCYFAGLTKIDLQILLPLVTFGRLPSILTSTLTGDYIGDRRYFSAALYFIITTLLSAFGLLMYRQIEKKNTRSA